MNNEQMQLKVGMFVVAGLALIAGLAMLLSKGLNAWAPTYEIHLSTPNAVGIKPGVGVLMAGVRVGDVASVKLDTGTNPVVFVLRILKDYKIHKNAQFKIEMSGFLGDQYVAIIPPNSAESLQNEKSYIDINQVTHTNTYDAPFNIQDTARDIQGAARAAQTLIENLDATVRKVDTVVGRVDRTLLTEETMTNLIAALGNFQKFSDRLNKVGNNLEEISLVGVKMVGRVDNLIATNAPPLAQSISNLVQFSSKLDRTAADLERLVATNKTEISAVIKNAETATATVTKILADLEKGRGLAGGLLKNEELNAQFSQLVTNLNVMVATYATFGSNLNRYGIFYKPEPASSGLPPKLRSVKPQD